MAVVQDNSDFIPSVSPANLDSWEKCVNTPELMSVSPNVSQSPDDSIQELLRKRNWLLARKRQLEVQLLANDPERNSCIDRMSEEDLRALQKSLSEKVQEKSVIKNTQEQILEGEQLRQLSSSLLFDAGNPDTIEKSRGLENHLVELTELVDKAEQGKKEVCELRIELHELQKQNFELKTKSRQSYEEIDKKKKEKEEEMKTLATDERGNSIQEQLESKLHENMYLRSITQGLIFGSGINWAQDEEILALMINAGQNPPI